ncbi:MAG TPA: CHRD domain-containing protein [Vicinamibacterales bacterium]|nr:CHRD domain-containing protein [Vicinamibacterales bacterium]
MKRLVAVTVLALGIAGCGGSNNNGNPNGPSNTTVFTVQLLPSNEVPPVTNAEQSARGTAVITINSQTNTIDFSVSLNSFPTTSSLTAAHIHPGAAGVNGGVLVGTGLTAGNAPSLSSGSATFSFTGVTPQSADAIAQILANPQNFYFNVHTAANTSGAIRGQLR